ncbi:MAG: carbohydrate-binding domain-containing protein [Clostridiales bacterium]|nr:carbohydrate-binding domain-containing protein [Candidatus Equinaster intestinalis]
MSTSKHIDKICIAVVAVMLVITVLFMFGEKLGITVIHREDDENTNAMFTENDLNADWDTNGATEIVLNGDSAKITGNGAYFSNNTVYISYAGKYLISGNLNGSVNIDADGDDKIWLLFDGVNITSKTEPPLYIKQADKIFLTLKENSNNTLKFENTDETSDIDGCIFSKDDLTVNGKGSLNVTSSGLHGIVCNDSLVFTGGSIDITAKNDGVHAHDAIKICNTAITVSAGDDGLHAGNDDETAVFYLESGSIDITECYEGIEANDITIAGGTVNITPSDDGINANGSGKTSLITVSGGDITVINKNGRDADGLDSNGSINITGGNVFISVVGSGTNNAVDYGSESGGKFTISGGTVVACGSSQMAEAPDSESKQGFIMENISGNENDTLIVSDKSGNEIISKEIPCSFSCILISSPSISAGDNIKMKIGDTEKDITVSNAAANTTSGISDKGGFNRGEKNKQRDFGNGNSPQIGNGETPPEKPDGDNMPFGNFGTDSFSQQQNGNAPGQMPPDFENGSRAEPPNGFGEMPNGENEKPNGGNPDNSSFDKSQNGKRAESENENNPSRNQRNMRENEMQKDENSKENINTVIYILISLLVLICGIAIAVKKKY